MVQGMEVYVCENCDREVLGRFKLICPCCDPDHVDVPVNTVPLCGGCYEIHVRAHRIARQCGCSGNALKAGRLIRNIVRAFQEDQSAECIARIASESRTGDPDADKIIDLYAQYLLKIAT